MSTFRISATFDPASARRVRSLLAFQGALDLRVHDAMEKSLDELQQNAIAYMYTYFDSPTGALESNFNPLNYGYEGELENDSPYAWRRDRGFSGMTDAMGRFFPNDPGIGYMEASILDSLTFIEDEFTLAIMLAFSDVGAL